MEISEVKELLKAFDESGSTYLEAELSGGNIKLMKPAGSVAAQKSWSEPTIEVMTENPDVSRNVQNAPEEEGIKVTAPLVGVFYTAPAPGEPSFAKEGDTVKEGDTLCLIEAMKMMNKIVAPASGTVRRVCVKDQDVVGFGDVLFIIGD